MVYGMQKILRRTFLQEIDGPLVTDDEDQPACSNLSPGKETPVH